MPGLVIIFLLSGSWCAYFLPPSPPLHISHISHLQYLLRDNTLHTSDNTVHISDNKPHTGDNKPHTSDLYVFLSVQLTKSPGISVVSAVLGFSPDQCQHSVLARANLHIEKSHAERNTVSIPVMLHIDTDQQIVGRVFYTCLRSHYSTREGEVFTGWRLQAQQFIFPLISSTNMVSYEQDKQVEEFQEEDTFKLELGGSETERETILLGQDLSWQEGQCSHRSNLSYLTQPIRGYRFYNLKVAIRFLKRLKE